MTVLNLIVPVDVIGRLSKTIKNVAPLFQIKLIIILAVIKFFVTL